MTTECGGSEFSVNDARVVVVGAARSGVAAAELLARRGAKVTLSEARDTIDALPRLRAAGVAVELGGHRPETLARAELVVLSPGVSPRLPVIDQARRRGAPVISEVELAARWLRGRIVAVTGTKGKTTTTTLTGRMIDADGRRALVGGNIGTALSSQVDESEPDAIHVVEVSSFQLELTQTFHPWIAVFLNLAADHLDRHASFQAYADAKARIFANQTSQDAMVINADDPLVLEVARRGRARQVPFAVSGSIDEGVTVSAEAVTYRSSQGEQPLMPLSAIRLPGRHLLSDVLAASAVGWVAGVSAASMEHAVRTFEGIEHALEAAGEIGGVRFVNDSKATNVMAARAAIECFERDVVVIMGGRFKGGELSDLGSVLLPRATAVVSIGEARDQIRMALGSSLEIREADTMRDAVRTAFALARPGGTVLLAPACASLDMFENYAERGRVFKKEVASLTQDAATR
jgi:UDP-N-acetylmuramoylalanine--D-glutamate ligase